MGRSEMLCGIQGQLSDNIFWDSYGVIWSKHLEFEWHKYMVFKADTQNDWIRGGNCRSARLVASFDSRWCTGLGFWAAGRLLFYPSQKCERWAKQGSTTIPSTNTAWSNSNSSIELLKQNKDRDLREQQARGAGFESDESALLGLGCCLRCALRIPSGSPSPDIDFLVAILNELLSSF